MMDRGRRSDFNMSNIDLQGTRHEASPSPRMVFTYATLMRKAGSTQKSKLSAVSTPVQAHSNPIACYWVLI
jgi:hypothetical protein